MRYEVRQKPDFAAVRVAFDQPGEELVVESAAMLGRDSAVRLETGLQGGFLAAAKRKLLGGESLFTNRFTATQPGQTLWLAPAVEGDIEAVELQAGMPLFLASGAFLAAAPSVKLDTQWQGARGFFTGAGLFLLSATGAGPLFFSAYGGIHAVDVGPAGYVCDTGHVVAFSAGLSYRVTKLGGIRSLFFSGEGLVCHFSGHGRLWISTRNPGSLVSFLHPFRPARGS
jgi:uncharacterized protein (TIGR00266 family)